LPVEFLWLTDKYDEYLNSKDYSSYMRKKGIRLPSNYNPKNDIIIEHPECLTLEELAAEEGAAKNRDPRLYEKLVVNNIECSKDAGYFWEYVFFENKDQLSDYKPYLNYLKTALIEDIYTEPDDEDGNIKAPFTIINYDEHYGSKLKKISDFNINLTKIIEKKIKEIESDLIDDYINIVYEPNPEDSSDLYLEIPEESNIIYTNYPAPTILALFSLNKKVIFIPVENDKTKSNIKTINKYLKINEDLELIFSNKFYYENFDSIKVLNEPIFFKPTRLLYHLLRIINPDVNFIQGFDKAFRLSQLFVFNIRVGLYKTLSSTISSKTKVLNKERRKMLHKFRFNIRKIKKEGLRTPSPSKSKSKSPSPSNKTSPKKEEYEIINGKKYKKCPEGQIRNPETMRCVSKSGAIGTKLLKQGFS